MEANGGEVSPGRQHERPPRRLRRIALASVGLCVCAGIAGVAMVGYGGSSSDTKSRRPAPRSTAKVERVTLIEGKTVKGNVEYIDQAALTSRIPGTFTRLPPQGQVLRPGDALYWVDNRRVILMSGELPAYRALAVGVSGPDVRQLEENLKALGYSGFTVDDTYTSATAAAVKKWQKGRGLEQTGSVELGRVVFRPKPVRVAVLKAKVGDPAQAGPAYEITSTERRVVLSMGASDHQLAPKNAKVTVIPGPGKTTPGTVSEVIPPSTTGDPKGDQTPKYTIIINVSDQNALGGDDQGPLDVRLVVGERPNVLAVPIVALLALEGNKYGVEVVTGNTTRIVPVQLGLFASGMVEITGEGISEGTEVSVPAP